MDQLKSNTKSTLSATAVIGYTLGFLGLSIFMTTQPVTALIPLLFAPVVCGTFGLILYKSQPNSMPVNAA